jgi:hypothetical protein
MKAEQLKASGGVLGVSNALSGFLEAVTRVLHNRTRIRTQLAAGLSEKFD